MSFLGLSPTRQFQRHAKRSLAAPYKQLAQIIAQITTITITISSHHGHINAKNHSKKYAAIIRPHNRNTIETGSRAIKHNRHITPMMMHQKTGGKRPKRPSKQLNKNWNTFIPPFPILIMCYIFILHAFCFYVNCIALVLTIIMLISNLSLFLHLYFVYHFSQL